MSISDWAKKFAKDVLKEPRCAVGLHDIDWKYDRDRSCDQSGKCIRPSCPKTGEVFTRQGQHVLSAWKYVRDDDCRMERDCTRRCGYPGESKVEHDWEPEAYIKVDKCIVEVRCRRNAEHRRSEVKHRRLVWQTKNNSSPCYQAEYCNHCHEFTGPWREQHEPGATALSCRQCREYRRSVRAS